MYDIVVIGAGTAGLSAAIYGVRAGHSVLVLEGNTYGGQIVNTPEIENYPGIAKISGFEFATGIYNQAVELGAEIAFEEVTGVTREGDKFIVGTSGGTYEAAAVILATGAKNRPLGLSNEQEWIGKGVSYCATCDGMFYKEKTVAVAGGGNTALEDALFLSNYCKKVYLIHRRDAYRAEDRLQKAIEGKENIEPVLSVTIKELLGEDRLSGVRVESKVNGETRDLAVDGIFVAIGQMPQNSLFADLVSLDSAGYIRAGEDCRTSAEGVFAAGDCRTKEVRQLTTAASDGAVAALAASAYLADR